MKVSKGGPLSKTDLEYLGYSKIEEHSLGDFSLPQRCRVFDATAPAGIGIVRHWFVYILADSTNRDLEDVVFALNGGLFKDEVCYIVIPRSLSDRNALAPIKSVHIFEDLMWEKIRQEFTPYMARVGNLVNELKAGIPYIEPSLSSINETVSPIKYFVDFFSGVSGDDNGVALINADASVGKTTLAVMVADTLVQQWERLHVIPVLLTGQISWKELSERLHGVTSLWDVLYEALNLEGDDFPLSDETFFTRIMRQGYIAFIFDGFDELRNQPLTARDNFSWLSNIALDSSARLMVTARTSFWEREVGTPDLEPTVLKLEPFSKDNARRYFNKAFETEGQGANSQDVKDAMQLYSQLEQATNGTGNANFRFVELPTCTAMIADYVKHGGKGPITDSIERRNLIREFFYGILERERERQTISTSSKDMLNIFMDVALYYNEFAIEDIEFVGSVIGSLDKDDLKEIDDHDFLNRVPGGSSDKYRFKHDFLLHYLRASRILGLLKADVESFVAGRNNDLLRLIQNEADGKGHLSEQMANFSGEADLIRFSEAYRICTNLAFKSFFFHVIAKTVVALYPGNSRRERADKVLGYLGGHNKQISDLFIRGTISDLSLKGWTIRDSQFTDFVMVKCDTDSLLFTGCRFSGDLDIPKIENIRFDKCEGEDDAKLVLSKYVEDNGITEQDIRKGLKIVLRRFRPRNHFKPVYIRDWKTGKTKNIEEHFDFLEPLKQEQVVEVLQQTSLQVTSSKMGEVRDFVDNGMLRGSLKAVFSLKCHEMLGN
ncbi:MAG: NACHT domain-containing protein [Candidatus Poribacteria bacterium]|nr:NACHT domain-containing protein [Candidatus Poribacteria bacterium]